MKIWVSPVSISMISRYFTPTPPTPPTQYISQSQTKIKSTTSMTRIISLSLPRILKNTLPLPPRPRKTRGFIPRSLKISSRPKQCRTIFISNRDITVLDYCVCIVMSRAPPPPPPPPPRTTLTTSSHLLSIQKYIGF